MAVGEQVERGTRLLEQRPEYDRNDDHEHRSQDAVAHFVGTGDALLDDDGDQAGDPDQHYDLAQAGARRSQEHASGEKRRQGDERVCGDRGRLGVAPVWQAERGDEQHVADQDRAEHVAMAEHGDHQEADRRQQGGGLGEGTHGQQRGRVVDDDAGGLQADQPEEQPDPGTHGEAQAHRNAVEQPFA